MIRYITRHGQPNAARFVDGNAMYPIGDSNLSDLGREQARLLGLRMQELGFHGLIISSPYARTMETAEIIAELTDCPILPYAPICEMMMNAEIAADFVGMNAEQLKARYPHVLPDAQLPWPWWSRELEDFYGDVVPRVVAGLPDLEKYADRELLFVGHGATARALREHYGLTYHEDPRRIMFNCSLCAFDPGDPDFKPYIYDTAHMGYERTTSNYLTHEDIDAKFYAAPYEGEIELPEGYEALEGERVLHIGDTPSWTYPYYKKLIETVKPDMIIHTGDMADEVKVGRIPGTEYEYLTKLRVLLDILRASGARIIIVRGNNDLPDDIRRLCPEAEVYDINQPMEFSGRGVRLGHQVMLQQFDRQYSLYGHGPTGETWSYEQNVPGQPCRFNVMWGSFLYDFGHDRFVRFPRVK